MSSKNFVEWVRLLESTINSAIENCFPRNWNEDYISRCWITEALKSNRTLRLTGSSALSVSWDAYKAVGGIEQANGDIAILVKRTLRNGNPITGVGFLEAKRIYPDNKKYTQLNWEQLQHQNSAVANHKLLLYDEKRIALANQELWPMAYAHDSKLDQFVQEFDTRVNKSIFTCASVCHSIFACASKDNSLDSLRALCIPLGYQICYRYLQGLELDYSSKLVERVIEGAAGGHNFLLAFHVSMDSSTEPTPETIGVSTKNYESITIQQMDEPEQETELETPEVRLYETDHE